MIKPNMSSIPGMGAVTDTLDFVKNLWGGMNVPGMGMPGMVMPTLSVEEINKQISDLKAVESWLTVNMNMLRGTIQALEVQSATIATLQSMGETLSAAVQTAVPPKPEPQRTIFGEPRKSKSEEAPEPAPPAGPKASPQETPKAGFDTKNPAAAFMASPQANPAMWWNMLQDQFKQAVTSAMATEPIKPPAETAASSSAQPADNIESKAKPVSAKRKTPAKSTPKT